MQKTIIFVIVMTLANAGIAFCQLTWVIGGGYSKDMRSETSNHWKGGMHFSVGAFRSINDKWAAGGRIAYNSWKVDGQGWMKDFEFDLEQYSSTSLNKSSGTQSVIEITPAVRYAVTSGENPIHISLQAGLNILRVSQSSVSYTYSYSAPNVTGSRTTVIGSQTLTGFGIQLALPIVVSNRIEIAPVYSPYSASGDIYHHYALTASLILQL